VRLFRAVTEGCIGGKGNPRLEQAGRPARRAADCTPTFGEHWLTAGKNRTRYKATEAKGHRRGHAGRARSREWRGTVASGRTRYACEKP